jgi:spore maturation protein CgeB
MTSSWGNGHATTYRALLKNLAARGHDVTFLERDLPFYAANRDLPEPPYGKTFLYHSLEELRDRFAADVREADLVVVGSYVPEGVQVGDWVQELAPLRCAFYDIDTPVTLRRLDDPSGYITREQIARYALYLSFTGGPTLAMLERELGSPSARALYCGVDPELHRPEEREAKWDLGYLGTYSPDRQPTLTRLLLRPACDWPAGRFAVAGAQYPESIEWPTNVSRFEHLSPPEHRSFYVAQRFTLNVTRQAMLVAGWSPSVRLFEAAACGTPIISDRWPGLDHFLTPGREVLIADTAGDALRILRELPESEHATYAARARQRVLAEHTSMHRAETLERYTRDLFEGHARRVRRPPSNADHCSTR